MNPAMDRPLVGVLALQGAFHDHERALTAAGAEVRRVRLALDLEGLDGLVMPGGESTTMVILLERMGLWGPVGEALAAGLPTLATCAGMILLARRITDGVAGQRGFEMLDIGVRRNGYGRQVESFEAPVEVEAIEGTFPGVFIRAPLVEEVGERARVVAVQGGRPVGVQQDGITALAFHPELSGDTRLHRRFVDSISARSVGRP